MDLIIVGAGSVGLHLAINLEEYTRDFNLIGFVDDDPSKEGKVLGGFPVLGGIDLLMDWDNIAVVIGIAFPSVKAKIIKRLKANQTISYPTLVSSRAWISKGVTLGKGCVLYPGVSINYGSQLDDFVIMNMNCAVGHDCMIGQYTSLAPGVNLGGHTHIGEGCDVGIGAASKQFVHIGNGVTVGGQTMLVKNVVAGQVIHPN